MESFDLRKKDDDTMGGITTDYDGDETFEIFERNQF